MEVHQSRGLNGRATTTNLQQTHEIWWNDMAQYNIKEFEKVLRNGQNGVIWNTIAWYVKCFILVPTMKPLD